MPGRLAGLSAVPALVKDNLTDEEAYIYVIETNLMQRSFNDMHPSEKAAVLELRYEKVNNQGRRSDIMKELQALENGEETVAEDLETDSRGRLAREYGLSGRTMARLLRLNSLAEEWKLAVDNNQVAMMVGVELSYVPEDLQEYIYKDCEDMDIKLSLKDARKLKAMYEQNELDETSVSKYLISREKGKVKKKTFQSIKMPSTVLDRYFEETVSTEEIQSVIESALEQYFDSRGKEV